MTINIDQTLASRKADILTYFRNRGDESLEIVLREFSANEHKERANAINKAVISTKNALIANIEQKARREGWNNEILLKCILLTTYASFISMLELRNSVWPYDYMTFSRRIGEIWEPFCKLCFEYPQKDIGLFVPPLFNEVKQNMTNEIVNYIDKLKLPAEQKKELKRYYEKVWSLVTSGEIKLELDLHFEDTKHKYNIDFKSGFGSNEKGNTNRLLLVATIYNNLEQNYKCILLVRSSEDQNNHYFQTLKNSGIWEAYCGDESYQKIRDYSGFDLKTWISSNIRWEVDLRPEVVAHLKDNDLFKYLTW
ncbi:MAG: hypothetical protein HZA22_01390 [Nitrospirae bacterium]|nr:hypothetical protein [Nitrospirota bacterium]